MSLNTVMDSNMGNGLVKNNSTNQWDVKVSLKNSDGIPTGVELNSDGSLSLKLDSDSTNEASLRSDGLYVGSKAKPWLLNLFVDAVNGIDVEPDSTNGAGTRAKPLKTLEFALKQCEYNKEHNIYLHAQQTHDLYAEYDRRVIVTSRKIAFRPYGDYVDNLHTISEEAKNIVTDAFQRLHYLVMIDQGPKIRFNSAYKYQYPYPDGGSFNTYSTWCIRSSNCTLYFEGIQFINNLDHTFEYNHKNTSKNIGDRINRIINSNGTIQAIHTSFETVGTPTLIKTGDTEPERTFTQFVGKLDGMYSQGFFHAKDCLKISIEGVYHLDKNWECFLLGTTTWDIPPDSSTSVILKNRNSLDTAKELSRRVFYAVRNGNVIQTPTTDMTGDEWVFRS